MTPPARSLDPPCKLRWMELRQRLGVEDIISVTKLQHQSVMVKLSLLLLVFTVYIIAISVVVYNAELIIYSSASLLCTEH